MQHVIDCLPFIRDGHCPDGDACKLRHPKRKGILGKRRSEVTPIDDNLEEENNNTQSDHEDNDSIYEEKDENEGVMEKEDQDDRQVNETRSVKRAGGNHTNDFESSLQFFD